MKKDDIFFLVFFIISLIIAYQANFSKGFECGKKEIINELCNKKQYDFCAIKKTTYILQE